MSLPVTRSQCGATLIEVMVAIIITAIGTIGMIALQMRSYVAESESYQRSQAAVLLQDFATRIAANGANAAAYVRNDIGVGAEEDCAAMVTRADQDVCELGNLLRGVAEVSDGDNVGAMMAARACVTQPGPAMFAVTVVWQGTVESAAPAQVCGQNAYTSENLRRALSTVVRIPDLAS